VGADADEVEFFLPEHFFVVSVTGTDIVFFGAGVEGVGVDVTEGAEGDPFEVCVGCGVGTADAAAADDAGSQCHFVWSFRGAYPEVDTSGQLSPWHG